MTLSDRHKIIFKQSQMSTFLPNEGNQRVEDDFGTRFSIIPP